MDTFKKALRNSGLKQRFIARELHMGESRLSRIANGHQAPTDAEKQSLAAMLRRPVAEVFPEDEAIAS